MKTFAHFKQTNEKIRNEMYIRIERKNNKNLKKIKHILKNTKIELNRILIN